MAPQAGSSVPVNSLPDSLRLLILVIVPQAAGRLPTNHTAHIDVGMGRYTHCMPPISRTIPGQ
jgi:hypothetical protein